MKILLYRWKVFNQEDITEALEKAGHTVMQMEAVSFSRKSDTPEDKDKLAKELVDMFGGYDAVFSVNYFIEVSNACEQLHIKYISWTVDSPMLTMYDKSVFNECNYCFVFDKVCFYTFKAMGVKKIWYLPLAVNAARLSGQLDNMSAEDMSRFSSDVSFVGGLYDKNSYDEVYDKLPEYLSGYFDGAIQAQGDLFGDNVFDRIFTPDILEKLSEFVDFRQAESGLSSIELVFKNTFLGYKHAQISRIKLLNMLASKFDMDLYSDKDDKRIIGANYRGTVDYYKDMPKVFRCSDININLTICNIRSGIPLRVWDVIGAKGFVLTNYQSEIPELFENGSDIVYYESFADCVNKTEYYLAHEDERKCIAENGYNKVLQYHSYDARIKFILDKLGCLV